MSAPMSQTKEAKGSVASDKNEAASIRESVAAPLIGAGANVYILTNELTQSMREKLGSSWPMVQDTLNSRYVRLLAGGVLASVTAVILWKLLRRWTKRKPQAEVPEGGWGKTYEVTPLTDSQPHLGRPDGPNTPLHSLPRKIQLRVAESPLQPSSKAQSDLYCKARDPATRTRHTRHREQSGQEGEGHYPHTPWHSEQQHSHSQPCLECCSCPSHLPPPRLLYSLRESRVVQRAMDMSDPSLINLLTYTTYPPSLCPTVPAHYPLGPLQPRPALCPLLESTPQMVMYPDHTNGRQCLLHDPHRSHQVHYSAFPTLPSYGNNSSFMHRGSHCLSTPTCDLSNLSLQQPDRVWQYPVQDSLCPSSMLGLATSSRMNEGRQQAEGLRRDIQAMGATCQSSTMQHQAGPHPSRVQAQHAPSHTVQSAMTLTSSQSDNIPLRPDQTPNTSIPYPTHLNHSLHPSNCHRQPEVYPSGQGNICHNDFALKTQNCTAGLRPNEFSHNFQSQTIAQSVQHQHTESGQRPVVQQPSDSSISEQNSSELCASQESRQSDGGSQVAQVPDNVPQEMLSLQTRAPYPYHSLPAITNYAQNEFPWRSPNSPQIYHQTPVYVFGIHTPVPPNPVHHSPVQQASWFMQPSPAGGFFPSSSPGLLLSQPPGQLLINHLHNPLLHPQGIKPAVFNPSFNLSNSNKHVLLRKASRRKAGVSSQLHQVNADQDDSNHSADVLTKSGVVSSPADKWMPEEDLLMASDVSSQREAINKQLQAEAASAAQDNQVFLTADMSSCKHPGNTAQAGRSSSLSTDLCQPDVTPSATTDMAASKSSEMFQTDMKLLAEETEMKQTLAPSSEDTAAFQLLQESSNKSETGAESDLLQDEKSIQSCSSHEQATSNGRETQL